MSRKTKDGKQPKSLSLRVTPGLYKLLVRASRGRNYHHPEARENSVSDLVTWLLNQHPMETKDDTESPEPPQEVRAKPKAREGSTPMLLSMRVDSDFYDLLSREAHERHRKGTFRKNSVSGYVIWRLHQPNILEQIKEFARTCDDMLMHKPARPRPGRKPQNNDVRRKPQP